MECNEGSGPMYMNGAWLSTCLDGACDTQSFDPVTPGSEPNPLLLPCTSTRKYRNVQDYLGACNGQSVSVTLADGGSAAGKAEGAFCNADSECVSHNCVAIDGQNFVCADPCSAETCAAGLVCLAGYCFPSCERP